MSNAKIIYGVHKAVVACIDMVNALQMRIKVIKSQVVLAIDPGKEKCGLAVVDRDKGVLKKKVGLSLNLEEEIREMIKDYCPSLIILGDRTGSKEIKRSLIEANLGLDIREVDEHLSTWEAEKRFLKENPPRGIWRLIPQSLQIPKEPFDDYVAVILAEKYFEGDRI